MFHAFLNIIVKFLVFAVASSQEYGFESGIIGKSLRWVEFNSLNFNCTNITIEYNPEINESVENYNSLCTPYHTGRWCEMYYNTCPHPYKVLVTANNNILPMLHSSRDGPINMCLRRFQEKNLIFIFMGDSQTRMSKLSFITWADKGKHAPFQDVQLSSYMRANGWSYALHIIDIGGILPNSSSTVTHLPLVYKKLTNLLNNAPNSSNIVIFKGSGMWDIVFAKYFDQYEKSYIDMMDKVFEILDETIRSKRHSIYLYIRNMYVSYNRAGKELNWKN